MATTTPNFGWAVPTSTDLVKDGAVAIETLGDSIDASLVDLKGGTTGQVLAKASGTDMDFSWVAIDPLVILDAKGDLITATAADTPARLAVGTNGQVLQADSTTATGLKWAAAAGGGSSVYCKALTAGANKSTTSTSFAAIDTTNLRITATPSGTVAVAIFTGLYSMSSVSTGELRLNCGTGTTRGFQFYNSSYNGAVLLNTYQAIITGLTAGVSYNFDWEWKVNAGTATLIGDSASVYPLMTVVC
jgi:hypothetical protein